MALPSPLRSGLRFSWPSPPRPADPAPAARRAVFWWSVAYGGCALTLVVVVGLIVHALTTSRHAPASNEPTPATTATSNPTPAPAPALAPQVAADVPAPAPPVEAKLPPAPVEPGPAPEPGPALPLEGAATCPAQTYGTSVAFLGSPAEAGAEARRDQKLVFLLHISGNFEDRRFT